MPPAANIDEVIAKTATDVANVSYLGVHSTFVQMGLWIDGLFGVAGIFPPSQNDQADPGQRPVTNWLATHLMAKTAIEGPGVGQALLVGTSAVINAVERVAYAVKYATLAGRITSGQQAAAVVAYNTFWQPV